MAGDPTGVVPMDGARGVASMAHQQALAAARGGAAGPASQVTDRVLGLEPTHMCIYIHIGDSVLDVVLFFCFFFAWFNFIYLLLSFLKNKK